MESFRFFTIKEHKNCQVVLLSNGVFYYIGNVSDFEFKMYVNISNLNKYFSIAIEYIVVHTTL